MCRHLEVALPVVVLTDHCVLLSRRGLVCHSVQIDPCVPLPTQGPCLSARNLGGKLGVRSQTGALDRQAAHRQARVDS